MPYRKKFAELRRKQEIDGQTLLRKKNAEMHCIVPKFADVRDDRSSDK
jgi:hypothetical protein